MNEFVKTAVKQYLLKRIASYQNTINSIVGEDCLDVRSSLIAEIEITKKTITLLAANKCFIEIANGSIYYTYHKFLSDDLPLNITTSTEPNVALLEKEHSLVEYDWNKCNGCKDNNSFMEFIFFKELWEHAKTIIYFNNSSGNYSDFTLQWKNKSAIKTKTSQEELNLLRKVATAYLEGKFKLNYIVKKEGICLIDVPIGSNKYDQDVRDFFARELFILTLKKF